MRLLLIRHGETVHNVAGVYAGVTDSALTNHGVLQANRLGKHLAVINTKVVHIFSSDLQRASLTAEAIRDAQDPKPPPTTRLELLREQDFGFYEGKQFFERPRDTSKSAKDADRDARRDEVGFVDVEGKESMRMRSQSFIDGHLTELLHEVREDHTVVVVAHGIILSHLWRTLLKCFHPGTVTVTSTVQTSRKGFSLEYLGGWSNTGYLDLEIKHTAGPSITADEPLTAPVSTRAPDREPVVPESMISTVADKPIDSKSPKVLVGVPSAVAQPAPVFQTLSLVVKAVNSLEHLTGLRKTRGGIGSLKHDSTQKTIDSFFKKRKLR